MQYTAPKYGGQGSADQHRSGASCLPRPPRCEWGRATPVESRIGMSLIHCTGCNGSISSRAVACPHCGEPQPVGPEALLCHGCFVRNDPHARTCRGCGKSLKEDQERERRCNHLDKAEQARWWGACVGGAVGFLASLFISPNVGVRALGAGLGAVVGWASSYIFVPKDPT